jgi:lysyl-tRNA synthetase class II
MENHLSMTTHRTSEYEIRKLKAKTLRDLGINPYVQKRNKTHAIADLQHREDLRSIDDIILQPHNTISIS